ncbi:NAD-dependent epimerase/dehydratase family protein [Solimonas sp. K1W22B-7]|uniref:NAD-dependent epimerase/dehydratase family protein n=1 Tax=Solimonas sp. K1W22B-7 TaxID=2303331 RepID=UPI000E32F387|nr:NAD-dependent epimerase/dehydratase family protein [Solimonas sp. K1W22B-7]AXQ27355.1 NAD-dependent epimerase/dehydratase family protein [Solimonas sp. K1W22B-7]
MKTDITKTRSQRSSGKHARLRRVLVTGGAGFIGSHTVEALLRRGYAVRVLDDLSTGKAENLPLEHARLELRTGSILDRTELDSAMQGIEGCIHLAAQVSAARSVEEPLASAERNVMGFINVLEALRHHAVQPRLVFASSAAIYGEPRSLPLTEEAVASPTNPYGLEKYVDELYADLYRRLHGVSSLGLRFFNVYGPRQDPSSSYSGVISRFIERIAAGETPTVFGDGRQTRDFIHVGDVAVAVATALDSDCNGACNVATGRRSDLLELLRLLGDCLGQAVRPQFEPARPGDIRDSCGDPARLREQLGLVAGCSLEDGLADLVASLSLPPPALKRSGPRFALP